MFTWDNDAETPTSTAATPRAWSTTCGQAHITLDVSHDAGLEYQLHQRVLPATYRTSMQEWRVWEQDVTDDADPVPFIQWLRAPGNLKRRLDAERR